MDKSKLSMGRTKKWSNYELACTINKFINSQLNNHKEEDYVTELQGILFDECYDEFDDNSFIELTILKLNTVINRVTNTFIENRR